MIRGSGFWVGWMRCCGEGDLDRNTLCTQASVECRARALADYERFPGVDGLVLVIERDGVGLLPYHRTDRYESVGGEEVAVFSDLRLRTEGHGPSAYLGRTMLVHACGSTPVSQSPKYPRGMDEVRPVPAQSAGYLVLTGVTALIP